MLAVKDIPDLQFDAAEPEGKGESAVKADVMEIMDVDTKGSVTIPQNSDSREHSRNLLESAAGEAPDQAREQRSVEKMKDPELHNRTNEYREHSQNLRNSARMIEEKTSKERGHRTLDRDAHPGNSENREHSRNSRIKQAGVDTGNVNVTVVGMISAQRESAIF